MPDTLAYRAGNFLHRSQLMIEPSDLAFERGFGVFDYCRVRNGRIPFLRDHLNRLMHSQSILNFEKPQEINVVRKVLDQLLLANDLTDSYFKIMITARFENDIVEPVLTVWQEKFEAYPREMFNQGISLIIEEYEKPFPEYKTTFYLGSLRTHMRMKASGAEDVLLYAHNVIRECSRCNIFTVKGETIYTPVHNILKGVTRHHVMECAREHFFIVEHDVTMEELFGADEVFITSTTKNVMPVVRIEDGKIGNGKPGKVTKKLIHAFEEYCNKYTSA